MTTRQEIVIRELRSRSTEPTMSATALASDRTVITADRTAFINLSGVRSTVYIR